MFLEISENSQHLCQSFFSKMMQASACNFIQKETLGQVNSNGCFETSDQRGITVKKPVLRNTVYNSKMFRKRQKHSWNTPEVRFFWKSSPKIFFQQVCPHLMNPVNEKIYNLSCGCLLVFLSSYLRRVFAN